MLYWNNLGVFIAKFQQRTTNFSQINCLQCLVHKIIYDCQSLFINLLLFGHFPSNSWNKVTQVELLMTLNFLSQHRYITNIQLISFWMDSLVCSVNSRPRVLEERITYLGWIWCIYFDFCVFLGDFLVGTGGFGILWGTPQEIAGINTVWYVPLFWCFHQIARNYSNLKPMCTVDFQWNHQPYSTDLHYSIDISDTTRLHICVVQFHSLFFPIFRTLEPT